MKIKNWIAMLVFLGITGCACIRSENLENQREQDRVIRIIKEEAEKISKQRKTKEIEFAVDSVNYDTGKPEEDYYQSPEITERIKRACCRDYAILCARRAQDRFLQELNTNIPVYVILGKKDCSKHAWNQFIYNGTNLYICPQTGTVVSTKQINDGYFSPLKDLGDYRKKRIKQLREHPDAKDILFNDQVPKEYLIDFGIPIGKPGRR